MASAGFLVLPSRERLLEVIDYLVQGSWRSDPADCFGCMAEDWCEECAQRRADRDLMLGVQREVMEAKTDGDARASALGGLAALMGITDGGEK